MEWSTPKFHWALHMGDYYDEFEELVNCWPLERKHKVPKSYGQDIRNTRIYQRSVLHEVVSDHLYKLSDPETFAFTRLGLLKPVRQAPKKVVDFTRADFGFPPDVAFTCETAFQSHPSPEVFCCQGDVVLFVEDDNDNVLAGELLCSLNVEGDPVLP